LKRLLTAKQKPHPKTKRLIAQVFGVEIEDIEEFKEPGVEEEVT
jgi:lambda repressor-like predicted transcriptional regulator